MSRIAVEREEHLKKGRISQEILRALYTRPISVSSLRGNNISSALLPRLEERGIGRKRRNSIRVAVIRLRRQKFIEYSAVDERQTMSLTTAGERRIQQYDFEGLGLDSSLRWDGVWRVVMFDIPEEKKTARDALSRKLKTIGFYQLQRSVFVHYLECQEEIRFIEEFFDIPGTITYAEAKILGSQDNQLRRHFKIK